MHYTRIDALLCHFSASDYVADVIVRSRPLNLLQKRSRLGPWINIDRHISDGPLSVTYGDHKDRLSSYAVSFLPRKAYASAIILGIEMSVLPSGTRVLRDETNDATVGIFTPYKTSIPLFWLVRCPHPPKISAPGDTPFQIMSTSNRFPVVERQL